MKSSPKRVVVAIGGNAIIKEEEEGNVYQQFANTRTAVRGIASLIESGYEMIVTHGNGPQVGNILVRVHAALGKAYPIPVGVAVAESQGEMGYMISQSLANELTRRGIDRPVAVLLTQVVCRADDPALLRPTKPIGRFHTAEEASRLREEGFRLVEDAGRGFRVVVPSPRPLRIVEKESIRILVRAGAVVIAAGGGGMPVYEQEDGTLEGIDGVVDKDLASSLLASELGAWDLVFLTGVDSVYRAFGRPAQRPLRRMTPRELRILDDEGEFPPGSMGPKVRAAAEFVEKGGRRVLITSSERLEEAFAGEEVGTWIEEAPRAKAS